MTGGISWTVDDWPVRMGADWEATDVERGGFEQFRGSCPAAGLNISQGSIVTGYRTDGTVLWQGRLFAPPKIREGVASIDAQGFNATAHKYERALLYRDDSIPQAVNADADPHGYGANNAYDLRQSPAQLAFTTQVTTNTVPPDPPALDPNAAAGFAIWYEGSDISRLSYQWENQLGTMPNFSLVTRVGTGPSGATTERHVLQLDGLGPDTVDINIGGDQVDQYLLRIRSDTTVTNTVRRKVVVRNISTWGRLKTDEISASDVGRDVANLLGFDPYGVTGSSDDITPLYWHDGSAAELLDYVCDLQDWHWGVREQDRIRTNGPTLFMGPYETFWRGALSRGIVDTNLTQIELYNGVRVFYTSTSGESRTTVVRSDPDPLKDFGYDSLYRLDLEDDQPNDNLAESVANRTLAWMSKPRVRGKVTVHEVQDDQGNYHSGYGIRAGDLLEVAEMNLAPQRVASVTYRQDGVDVELSEDIHMGRMLYRLQHRRKRRRH